MHDEPIDLIDVAAVLDGNPRAVLFKAAGPEKAELVGNVMGSRKRLASALDTDERGLLGTLNQRLNRLQPPIKVSSQQAPVQQVVLKDDEADLTALPVHLQHGADGAPYISAGIDYALFPGTGFTNVGCRRIMLRGPRQAGVDLIAPSDMRAIYLEARRAQGAGAGRLCGRLASGRFSRRDDGAAQCRRTRRGRRGARRSRCRWSNA